MVFFFSCLGAFNQQLTGDVIFPPHFFFLLRHGSMKKKDEISKKTNKHAILFIRIAKTAFPGTIKYVVNHYINDISYTLKHPPNPPTCPHLPSPAPPARICPPCSHLAPIFPFFHNIRINEDQDCTYEYLLGLSISLTVL